MIKNKNLTETDLLVKDFRKESFIKCIFSNNSLKFVNFSECTFSACDFSGADMELASFDSCSFDGCKLSFLDFGQTHLYNCDFSRSIVNESIFHKIKVGTKDERKEFNLTAMKFEETDLSRSVFIKCNLKGVAFNNSNLQETIFEKCNLEDAILIDAHLEGTRFEGSKIKNTKLTLGGFIEFGQGHGFVLE